MSPIVTTSSHREKPKVNPLVPVMAVVILALVFLLIRKPSSNSTPPPVSTPETEVAKPSPSTKQPTATRTDEPDAPIGKAESVAVVAGVSDLAAGRPNGPAATETNASPETAAREEDKPKPMPSGVLSKQYFDNPVENRLEKLGIPGRGVAMVLPNKLSQEEVLAILRRPIQINEDDDEETVAAKERTAEMKTAALEYIESGGTFDEFIAEMVKTSNEEAAMKKSARAELNRLLKEGNYEAAAAYLEEANKALREAGLKEMGIPPPYKAKFRKAMEALEQ